MVKEAPVLHGRLLSSPAQAGDPLSHRRFDGITAAAAYWITRLRG
jgi:hypothetical protein